MKKITLLLFTFVFSALYWQSRAQSTIHITTSGGSYATEKWVSITTEANGAGTQVWGQGDGTYGNGAGLINLDISIAPGTYYVNCYDKYADGWDGSLISVTAYGSTLTNNGGASPNGNGDLDATPNWGDTQAQELEASLMIVVPNPPSCLPPLSLTNTDVTSTSANFQWTEAGSAASWNVEIKTGANFTPGTGANDWAQTVTSHPTNFAVFQPNTTYYWYVQSDCGAESTSTWSGPFSFTTLCSVQSLPYLNDFNTDMNCWTVENVNADTRVWQRWNNTEPLSCINTASTDFVLGVAYNSTLAANDFAFSPGFQLQAGTNYTLEFSYGNDGETTYTENMTVYLCNASNSTSALAGTQLFTQTAISGGCQSFIDGDITVASSGVYYVAFHGNSLANMDILMIDDFSLMETPACPVPTTFTLVSYTATDATFSWTTGAAETQWDIEWGPDGFVHGAGNTVSGITTNPYTLSGLVYGTDYDVYLRANCGTSQSTWVGPISWRYLDLSDCVTVVSPLDAAVDVPVGDVTFSWSASSTGEPAVSYNLYYGLTASTVTTLVGNYTTTSQLIPVEGFLTTFYWKIVPVNANGQEATGCPVWSFTTEAYVPPVCTVTEYFEETTIPTGWSTVINAGTCNFAFGSGDMPTGPDFVSGAAIFDDDACGEDGGVNNVSLLSPVYDLTGATSASLGFDVAFQDYAGSGEFSVEVFNGTAWVEIVNYNTTDLAEILSASFDVFSSANNAFQVRFTYDDEGDWAWGAGLDNFCINTDAPGLGIANEIIDGFAMYPNPVENTLTLKALNAIDAVSVYNMLGQEVMKSTPSATQVQLDMTQLPVGTYVVKVQAGSQLGSYSLIKQ